MQSYLAFARPPALDDTAHLPVPADTTPVVFAGEPAYVPLDEHEAFADEWGSADTIVFPSAGPERAIRSHRRDEPRRRAAFRVLLASAISGSGIAIAIATAGGGTPPAPDAPAALPRVASTAGGPTTSDAASGAPAAAGEPTSSAPAAAAPVDGGQTVAQVRAAPWVPQAVGPLPGTDAQATTAPPTTTPAPTGTTSPSATVTPTPTPTPTTPGGTPAPTTTAQPTTAAPTTTEATTATTTVESTEPAG